MFIRHLTGPRKGESEDVAYIVAQTLIENGCAELLFPETIGPHVRSERIDIAKPVASVPHSITIAAGKRKR